mmetsp:Transcript_29200/g.80077  ORF Transcript_29200/g.80077 Transcript_29200/m.80077 type:complete len:252 (+) Transcript_29200:286-1041(+)
MPTVPGRVPRKVILAHPIGIPDLKHDEVIRRHGGRVAHAEGETQHGCLRDVPPNVNENPTSLEQLLDSRGRQWGCAVGILAACPQRVVPSQRSRKLLDAPGGRIHCVVVMHAICNQRFLYSTATLSMQTLVRRLPLFGADVVVKSQSRCCPSRLLHERLALGVIRIQDGIVVIIVDVIPHVRLELEAVGVERESLAPAIGDLDLGWICLHAEESAVRAQYIPICANAASTPQAPGDVVTLVMKNGARRLTV